MSASIESCISQLVVDTHARERLVGARNASASRHDTRSTVAVVRGEELALGSASEHTARGQDVIGARNLAASHAVLGAGGSRLASTEVVAGVGVSAHIGTEDSVGADDVAVVSLVVVDVPCESRGGQGDGKGGDSDELHGDGLKVKLRVQNSLKMNWLFGGLWDSDAVVWRLNAGNCLHIYSRICLS